MEEEITRLQDEYKKLCAEFETLSEQSLSSPGQVMARKDLEKKIEKVVARLRELTQKLKPKEL